MSTGTLHVNTEIDIYQNHLGGTHLNNCSLIFQWTSKTKSLSAPDKEFLQKPRPISSLPIYVDFLPAPESLKPASPGAGDEHDYFIVPKRCNVCLAETFIDRWRQSWCMAEIQAITHAMSDKQRRCYQIMKYLSEARRFNTLPNYYIKTVVLRHHTTCSDVTDDTVDCVMEMFRDVQQAYKTKELLSYQSNLNILNKLNSDECEPYINTLCSVSVTDSWETFIRKMKDIGN